MNTKLIAILLLASIFLSIAGCGKSDEEKNKEAAAAFGYGTKLDPEQKPHRSKF